MNDPTSEERPVTSQRSGAAGVPLAPPELDRITALATRMAIHLPPADLQGLAGAVAHGSDALEGLAARASSSVIRSACTEIRDLLAHRPDAAAYLVGALAGASRAVVEERHRSTIEVTWTGPTSTITTSRLTSAVVVDLIGEAGEDVLLTSYAATSERTVRAALIDAAGRGVSITLLLEHPSDNPRFTGNPDPFPGLRARRLTWPADQRPSGAALHAKILVVDRRAALVGSANLTAYAMDRNLECGILIRGGHHPARIRDHITSLLDTGRLQIWNPTAYPN